MLLFKKKFLDLIRAGHKTQTVRVWPHRKMRAGQRSYIPGIGYIEITTVDEIPLDELTEEDALLDGFATAELLRREIEAIYSQADREKQRTFRVRFRVYSESEQIEARRAKAARDIAASPTME